MGWLDAAWLEVADLDYRDILRKVAWRFKGGKLGEYAMQYPTESSETRYPQGHTSTLWDADGDSPDLIALQRVTRTRIQDKRKRARGCADWAASHHMMSALWEEAGASQQVETGLRAVYRVLRDIWDNCDVPPRSAELQRLKSFVRETTMASAAASFLDIPTTAEIVNSTFSALSFTRMERIRMSAAEFHRVLRYSGSHAARVMAVKTGRQIMSDPDGASSRTLRELGAAGYVVAGRTYHVGHGCVFLTIASRPIALSRSDIVRVHQFLSGIQSGLFATVSQACVAPGPERAAAVEIGRAYEAQVSRILDTAATVPPGDEVSVCKAYKRAFGAFLGELSGPLCRDETMALWKEALETKSSGGLDLAGWVRCLRRWTASTAFNLGKVYKLCPAPDACPGLTLIERHEMVCNHNTPQADMIPVFKDELRAQILRAYIRTPGVALEARGARPTWWASYKAGRYDEVPSTEIHSQLAWEGTAKMPSRSPDNPAVWKDSGLGWDTYELALDPDRPQRHGNMLMRMVFDKSAPMPGVRHGGHEHSHKVDIKPEGHKDPARGIYSGNVKDRLNQSWMESAVQDVAGSHPSFMIGANSEVRDARVRAVVERPHDPGLVALYYSFDIAGWSPRMPPETQHASHEIWADLYDEPLFRSAQTITDDALVYMNKGGYSGWFKNPGTNFEGYNGKEMTMILITLMSLAVKAWRHSIVQARLATPDEANSWSAVLLAYIDDGLAKVILPLDRAEALFELFKRQSEATFAACGYTIEPSKCYPSDRFAIFLNEPYLAGRHVTHGTRAAMTICAENTEEHTSIVERLTAVSTGCRGAVMAGLDATAGIMLQAFHAHAHMAEWVHRVDPVVAALWYVMPRAWGGLGMPTALQLGTSGSGSAFEESIRTVQHWAKISTPARRAFLIRARAQLSERSATGILLAPLGGRTKDGTMVETRVPDAVRKALVGLLASGRLSPLARDFLAYSSPESLDAYSAAIVRCSPGTAIQEQLLNDLASAHPHAIFSAFARRIEKSTTLMQLVGQREMRRIIKANRTDAAESYSAMRAILIL